MSARDTGRADLQPARAGAVDTDAIHVDVCARCSGWHGEAVGDDPPA
ncbi:hypothetical protein [Octadecabacter dasysiphoniae]|nr:hypothetical protein [Octadecabacter dasysiphoniae]